MSETFAEMIGRRRVRLGLTQGAMAHHLDVHVATYQQWELGRHRPNSQRRMSMLLDTFNRLESELVMAIMAEQANPATTPPAGIARGTSGSLKSVNKSGCSPSDPLSMCASMGSNTRTRGA